MELKWEWKWIHNENGNDIGNGNIMEIGNEMNIKGKALFFPVRIALYGDSKGPDIPLIFSILGKAETIQRLEKYI